MTSRSDSSLGGLDRPIPNGKLVDRYRQVWAKESCLQVGVAVMPGLLVAVLAGRRQQTVKGGQSKQNGCSKGEPHSWHRPRPRQRTVTATVLGE
jgi:hypothetical protein